MAYPVLIYSAIRDNILRDIANQNTAAYVGKDSDFYVRANANGAATEGLYQHQAWIARQIFADTADSDYLETMHCNPRGIYRKGANAASGSISVAAGTPGTLVPIGSVAQNNSGLAFVTTAAATIASDGTATIPAAAQVAGSASNQAATTPLTWMAPPNGVQPSASIVSMTGGTDLETDTALLGRYLFDLQNPPAGGSQADYIRWAMSVPGVTNAYIYPQRRNTRSVDVVIETAGGLASSTLIAAVQTYINGVRPVCADVLVMAPSLLTVNIAGVLTLEGISLADATTQINILLAAYFNSLAVGQAVVYNALVKLMMSVSGVVDVSLTAPAANVTPLLDNTHTQMASLGTVTLTL